MVQQGVNNSGAADPVDDRGIPIKNLQEEFARKLDKVTEEINGKFEALTQKLDGLTRLEEPPPTPVSIGTINEREELVKISARPRGYVDDLLNPLKEKADALEKEVLEQRKAVLTSQWERMEDRIARQEGKKDWKELPEQMQKDIRQEIISRGWQNNPAAAMDAYDLVKARDVNLHANDPDRLKRIHASQTEGSGRTSGQRSSVQSLPRSMVSELSRTPPSHPDYKKNMETLDKVQKGYITLEG